MLQYQVHSTRPLTTAHLAQTMTLLGMTTDELQQKIETELANNPALELKEERRCPTCRRPLIDPGPCPLCSLPTSPEADDPIVFVSATKELFHDGAGKSTRSPSREDLPDDNLALPEDLSTFVFRQIAADLDPDDRRIAAYLLTNLDDDGLLRTPLLEISRYLHVPMARIKNIIHQIQHTDPLGVGSSSPQEALLVQLNILKQRQCPVPNGATRAIQEGLDLLSRLQYTELAKRLEISTSQAEEIARFVSANLNPFPGRAYWGDHHHGENSRPLVYRRPDVIITKLNATSNSPLVVEIILPINGWLQINKLFREMAKIASSETQDEWKEDLEKASLLIKCLQQRNNAMRRLMTYLCKHQREFILHGDEFLRPTTRAFVALELGVHESTISRAVNGKSVQLPSGKIIPLAQFFDRSLHIRAHLKKHIALEKQPLTDSQLVALLKKDGFKLARRTVAKYRSMEGILPAHLRKNRQPASIETP